MSKAFGEQNPTLGEDPVSWQTWSDGAGGIPEVVGNADWGKLKLDYFPGEEGRSAVYDLGSAKVRKFTLTENRYGTGAEDAVLQYRTDTVAFLQDAVLPAWTNYSGQFSVNCRYVQVRETTLAFKYVDATNGNDGWAGTFAAPWKTIAKVNAATLVPGDVVLFKCGEMWRETLVIGQTGTSGSPITYGSYGTGAKPIINGADILPTWANHAGNVWKANVVADPRIVIFNGTVGNQMPDLVSVDSEFDYFWSAGVLYVYSSGGNPSIAYINPGVEAGKRDRGITDNAVGNKNYITIKDLTIYGVGGGVWARAIHSVNNTGWIYSNLKIEKCGVWVAICSYGGNYHTVSYCTLTGVRSLLNTDSYGGNGISFIYDINSNSNIPHHIIVDHCVVNYWSGYAISCSGKDSANRIAYCEYTNNNVSHCASGIYPGEADHVIIHDNICDDNLVGGYPGAECYGIAFETVSNSEVYNNTCTNGRVGMELWAYTGTEWPDSGPSDNNKIHHNIFANNSAWGFLIYEGNCDNTEIYSNLVYENNAAGIQIGNYNVGYESTNCTIYNNTVYGNNIGNGGFADMNVSGSCTGWTIKNNIFSNTNRICFNTTLPVSFGGVHSNNCYYRASGTVINNNGTTYDLAHVTDFEATAIAADPKFDSIVLDDYDIQSDSPCINAGVNVGLTEDYEHNPIVGLPDIGAYEYT
jgi:hypothetical protein